MFRKESNLSTNSAPYHGMVPMSCLGPRRSALVYNTQYAFIARGIHHAAFYHPEQLEASRGGGGAKNSLCSQDLGIYIKL